jgi:outer membrane protein OmpA-like peptidoglycan-associated protein
LGQTAAPPIVHDVLRLSGQPLDTATRAFMEPRVVHDFSQVRVHTDARAATSSQAIQARAHTTGHNIVFATNQYSPHTENGKRLLAHELTHVIEQEGHDTQIHRKPAPKKDCPEREPGEVKGSASSPYRLMERSPQQEWLIYDFRVGSSAVDSAKGDMAGLIEGIVNSLAKGHFVYVTGQDPVEVLGYSDCHGSPITNEKLRTERAANFCSAVQSHYSQAPKSFERFIRSCRAAPAGDYAASNATREGRSQNRGVLIRVLPPPASAPTSPFPYDEKYGPIEGNCATYKATADFLNREYANNAYCACTHTPDEPHNNCVRKCLQSKLWPFLAANAEDLRSGRFIWCPTIWKHHRECYSECGCDNSFIDFVGFLPICTEKFSCPAVGLSIALFNKCMEPKE